MATILIIIGIIIFVTSAVKGNKKQKITHTTSKPVLQKTIVSSDPAIEQHKYHVWEQREDRKRRIWSVLFIANSIHKCQAEYTTKRDWQYLDSAINAILDYKPTYRDILTAIRFCQIEYARGYCDRKLTKQDLFILRNIRQLIANDQLPVNRPECYR